MPIRIDCEGTPVPPFLEGHGFTEYMLPDPPDGPGGKCSWYDGLEKLIGTGGYPLRSFEIQMQKINEKASLRLEVKTDQYLPSRGIPMTIVYEINVTRTL